MNTKTNSRASNGVQGQALVEFALVVPLLALLLFGIIQHGFIFNGYMNVRHAAHVTARSVALSGAVTNMANVTVLARQAILPPLDPSDLTSVTVQNVTLVQPNDALRVTLNYSLPLFMRFVVPGATNGRINLSGSAVYRRL